MLGGRLEASRPSGLRSRFPFVQVVTVLRRRSTKIIVLAVLAVFVALAIRSLLAPVDPESLTIAEFRADLLGHRVLSAEVARADRSIHGELVGGLRFTVDYPGSSERGLTEAMTAAGVDFKVDTQRPNQWLRVLAEVLPFVLLFGMLGFIFRQVNGRMGGGFGRAKPKLFDKDNPTVKFADVAGLDEAVEELNEIKEFLTNPKRFEQVGARIPKGVLLYGPPGTGKTLLARAVAGEAGVPFFSLSGSNFVEMFVGVGAARVRDLFAQAKAAAPAIIFIDEIDAVGRHRGAGVGGGHDERDQTLNQMLVEMDGFEANTGVILIAATTRPDILDPALLRPGRFDRQVAVDRPDLAGRRQILTVHAAGKPLAVGIDLEVVARRTPGFTGADLANVLNEAALLSARRGFSTIGFAQMEEAIDRVMAGPERRTRFIAEHERQIIAYHEAGHAVVGHVLPHTDPVHKVSIIPRGAALGFTLTLPVEDRFLVRRSELHDQITMLLGGRAAELLVYGDPTTGAQNDIERASALARQMATEFGMTDRLGPVRLGNGNGDVFLGRDMVSGRQYSEEIAAEIDAEVRMIVDAAHTLATEILVRNRFVMDQLAAALIEHETLEVHDVQALLAGAEVLESTLESPGTSSPAGAVAATEQSRNVWRHP